MTAFPAASNAPAAPQPRFGSIPDSEAPADDAADVFREPWVALGRLVHESDRIVIAELVAVHDVPRGPELHSTGTSEDEPTLRLLELRVDDVVWGDSAQRSLCVLAGPWHSRALDAHGIVIPGDRAYWFLQRSLAPTLEDDAARERLASISGTAGLHEVAVDGLGRLPIEGSAREPVVCWPGTVFQTPPALPIVDRHEPRRGGWSWSQVRHATFDAWLRAEIDRSVPSLVAEYISNGVGTPRVTIDRDGRVLATGEHRHDDASLLLEPARWQALLELAQRNGFYELPGALGSSPRPCSGTLALRIRGRNGARTVHVYGPAGRERDPLELVAAHGRALTILDAVPFARDWAAWLR
jgi:hypothetical protein